MVILGGDKACLGGKGGVSGGKDIMLLGTLSWILSGEQVAYIKEKKKRKKKVFVPSIPVTS